MHPDRIDFSSLDPSRDGHRWGALVRDVSARAVARQRNPVLRQLTAWGRLALAAVAALVCWLPAFFTGKWAGAASASEAGGVRALSEWAASGPTTSNTNEVLSSLGVSLE